MRHESKWCRCYDGEGGQFFVISRGAGTRAVHYHVRPFGKGKWAVERNDTQVSELMSFRDAKKNARAIAQRMDP